MARLITSGFESQKLTTVAATNGEGQGTRIGGAGTLTIDTTTPRSGAACASSAAAAEAYFQSAISGVAGRSYFVRQATRFSSVAPSATLNFLQIFSSVRLLDVALLTTGEIVLRLKNASTILSTAFKPAANTWYVFELKTLVPAAGEGTVQLVIRSDAGAVLYESAGTTAALGTAAITSVFSGRAEATDTNVTVRIDDLAINDDQGASQTSFPGPGKIVLLKPIEDSALGTGWQNPDNSTTKLWEDVDNTPPVGVASPGSGKSQVKNASATAGELAYDAVVQSYETGGVGAADTVNLTMGLFRLSGSSTTGTNNALGKVVSNPADAGNTTFTSAFDIVAGTEPTGWGTWLTTVVYAPSVTKATKPVIRIIKNDASTRVHMADLMGLLVEYTVSTTQKVTLTPATTTDSAQAITEKKRLTLTPGAEADAGQKLSIKARIHVDLTAATEADAAQTRTLVKSRTVTPATEADAAVAHAVKKMLALTPVTEADAAVTLVVTKPIHKTLTPASEADAAVAITLKKWVTLTAATLATAAQAITVKKRVALTAAAEAAAAVAQTVRKLIGLTPASEADAAIAHAAKKRVTLTAAAESDVGVILGFHLAGGLTAATETNSAVPLVYVKPIYKTLTPGTESDAAQPLTDRKRVGLTPASESDLALPAALRRRLALTPATEADVAQSVRMARLLALIAATEADGAVALTWRYAVALVPGEETDAANPLSRPGELKLTLVPAAETDRAVRIFLVGPESPALSPFVPGDAEGRIAGGYDGRMAIAGREQGGVVR